MLLPKSKTEVMALVQKFDVPALKLERKIDAGPDEELYLFSAAGGRVFGLWQRDYMDELQFEAQGLENNFDLCVECWVPLKDSEELTFDEGGDTFALFERG